MKEPLKTLFRKYEDAFSRLDGRAQAELFDGSFMSAGPKGAIASGREQFIGMADQAADFYRKVGQKSARILHAKETAIGPDYSLATLHWGVTFEKTGDKVVEFDVSYIVRKTGGDPKIVMFIAHEDEDKAMQELGLVPEEQHA